MRSDAAQRGFSLVELVTVVVILAVLAGLVTPRLISSDDRRARAEAESAADLLSAAARRDLFTSQRIAVEYDSRDGRLRVLTRRPLDAGSFGSADERWLEDPLAPSVQFQDLSIEEVMAAGARLDARRFRIEFPPAGTRPEVVLVLADSRGSKWTARLGALHERAGITEGLGAAADTGWVDLDATGRREDPW